MSIESILIWDLGLPLGFEATEARPPSHCVRRVRAEHCDGVLSEEGGSQQGSYLQVSRLQCELFCCILRL